MLGLLRSVRGDQRGFTLPELLVTVAILGMVMTAVLTVYMTGNTAGVTGENRAEAQQAARAAMLMEEDLKLIGLGCPPAGCPPPAVVPLAGCPPPAQRQIICATPTAMVFWADLTNTSTTLTANANAGANALNVVSNAGFAVGEAIYLINGGQFAQHNVTAVPAAGTTISVNPVVACPAGVICPPAYPQGVQVGRPRLITYSWNPATLTLSKDAGDGNGLQPLVTGIQNFDLRYFNNFEAEIPPANLAANLANILRIQISMTAQSAAAQNRQIFPLNSSVRPRNLCCGN
jgi:prepilin-type N-terminal cleavage/methylation domain-containing protein